MERHYSIIVFALAVLLAGAAPFDGMAKPLPDGTDGIAGSESSEPISDKDGDGLDDSVEGGNPPPAGKTNQFLSDTDGDGISDSIEDLNGDGVYQPGLELDPRSWDTDGDGYEDGIEGNVITTSPVYDGDPAAPFVDADGDYLPAAVDPDDYLHDVDGDRFVDGYEAAALGLGACLDPGIRPSIGDSDLNGTVDNADAQHIIYWYGNRRMIDTLVFDTNSCDVNRNAAIDNADAQLVLDYFSNMFVHYLPTMVF